MGAVASRPRQHPQQHVPNLPTVGDENCNMAEPASAEEENDPPVGCCSFAKKPPPRRIATPTSCELSRQRVAAFYQPLVGPKVFEATINEATEACKAEHGDQENCQAQKK